MRWVDVNVRVFCPTYPREGLVHIGQLSNDHVENATDVVRMGQRVWIKVIKLEEDEASGKQKLGLSMK